MENLMVKMETTNKGKEVIAYKCMNSDMCCKGFKYEIGKSYKTDKAKLCECGFHACLNPQDTFIFYSQGKKSRYFKVKLSGEIAKCDNLDTKVAATEITILEEITDNFNEVIETTEWWKNDNVLDLLPWSEGFAKIQRGDYLFNFIDKQGKCLSKKWFKLLGVFHEGFAVVQRKDKLYNFIDKKGNYLFNKWFDYLGNFHEGFAIVRRGYYLYNFIDKDEHYLSKEWFKCADDFHEGFAEVKRTNGKWYKIDKNGNLLPNEWIK